jgi:CubicO group peptidase (beta-lactamase class C family)
LKIKHLRQNLVVSAFLFAHINFLAPSSISVRLSSLKILYSSNKEAFGHGEGFQHYTICFPEKGIGIVILSNSDNAEGIFKEIIEISITDIFTPWKWENYIP